MSRRREDVDFHSNIKTRIQDAQEENGPEAKSRKAEVATEGNKNGQGRTRSGQGSGQFSDGKYNFANRP